MGTERLHATEAARAALRVRLVGIALASTILLLAARSDRAAAAAVLIGYAIVALALRVAGPRSRLELLPALGVAVDVGFATAVVLLLPFSVGSWALYALPIATAALRYGPTGALVATAAAVVSYDLALASEAELRAADLWPVQVLLAFELLAAELVWGISRAERERRRLGAYALAQRDLMAADGSGAILDRLTDHATRTFQAKAAWIATPDVQEPLHARGDVTAAGLPKSFAIDGQPGVELRATFAPGADVERDAAALRDLASDVAPLLVTARERERIGHLLETTERVHEGLASLVIDRSERAVIDRVLATCASVSGVAAIIRRSDGAVIAGDLEPAEAAALTEGVDAPSVVRLGGLTAAGREARSAAVLPAGTGHLLVVVGTQRALTDDDLAPLGLLADVAGAITQRVTELDSVTKRADRLDREVTGLRRELRERDDALHSVVHELRNPLTSVQAYGQLMSRSLQAVQRQVGQLDRLIEDLVRLPAGAPSKALVIEDVDLVRETREAVNRLRVVAAANVQVFAEGAGPFMARADPARLAQVLDNLLRNAAKFSPQGEPIDVAVRREGDEIVVSVSDSGEGVAPEERDRIFERYFRGSNRGATEGEGIGLAVSREIVEAHGGRIWMRSRAPESGSTFFIALPAAGPSPSLPEPAEATI